ncbi:acyl-CoA thioesterase [Pseudoalteromonas sp. JBTF-M23]|uniref:Acyl-CoA thioesterase n=1 Tax=Pseudoalteromonas caenipelagi TaxID=2726988 RepID=A0A849V8H0_9GAMM|nr:MULTISPECIES: acyl-CoA thioesterase [Pseudoalteromonas]MBD1583732.1 acyl-CoA thioesterase [Pseudoalteromonas sp. S16_S37]NOU49228.1 acyl-CoA thioesterase [Pseudoalteromonas caenipelagi]BBN81511.1 acyl-CoA thioesterase [Pseudoalteromonas sp. A25]
MSGHSEVVFRFLAEPTDVNFGGKVHGGIVMKWIDQAGYACAAGWSGSYCVTVSVAGVRFKRPILVGQIVEVSAQIAHTGKTSMQIFIRVRCGDPQKQSLVESNHCIISFIAMDKAGYPVPVPQFKPKTEEQKKLELYAIKMKEIAIETESLLQRTIED